MPRCAARTVTLGVQGLHGRPLRLRHGRPTIVQLAQRSYAEVAGGDLRDYPATGLTDGRFFALYQDTPVACFGPDAQDIHGIDESVGLDSMHDITRTIALTMAEWCGVEAAS